MARSREGAEDSCFSHPPGEFKTKNLRKVLSQPREGNILTKKPGARKCLVHSGVAGHLAYVK